MPHRHAPSDPAAPAPASPAAYVRSGIAGAGLAAALVGGAEAAVIWGLAELGLSAGGPTLLYALGLHGALGAVGGALVGLLLAWGAGRRDRWPTPERAAAVLAGVTFLSGAGAVGSFRLARDAHLGRAAAVALALALGVAGALALGAAVRRWVRRAAWPGTAVALASLAALGVGHLLLDQPPPVALDAAGRAGPARPNVVVVVADTLRADATGPLTPHLEAFAREGIRFGRAYANASWTRPAVASILTGRLPSAHGVTGKASALPAGRPTLATWFSEAGYATAATVTNVNLAPDFGFGRGFGAYRYHAPRRPLGAAGPAVRLSLVNAARLLAERLSARLVPERFYAPGERMSADAAAVLDELGDGPFLLWVHYMDPHDPFHRRPLDGTGVARVRTPHPAPGRAGALRRLYEGEVRHWDAAFGTLVDTLERRGLLENTVVAVTSDHGEEFQEHGGYWHGQTLFEEAVRVPLVIRLPGGARAGEVDPRLASHVDLAPTLLRAAGLAVPPELTGQDLLRREAGGEEVHTVVMETAHDGMVLSGLVWDRFKYVAANPDNPRGLPRASLFDLEADPGELHDLAAERPTRAADMAAMLERRLTGRGVGPYPGDVADVDPALEEDLRSLGYVQ